MVSLRSLYVSFCASLCPSVSLRVCACLPVSRCISVSVRLRLSADSEEASGLKVDNDLGRTSESDVSVACSSSRRFKPCCPPFARRKLLRYSAPQNYQTQSGCRLPYGHTVQTNDNIVYVSTTLLALKRPLEMEERHNTSIVSFLGGLDRCTNHMTSSLERLSQCVAMKRGR